MIRKFSLDSIQGGNKMISTENALMLELSTNPVLSNTLFSLMDNPEIKQILSNPTALHEFSSLVNRLDPKFVESLPRIFDKYKTIYGMG